MACSGERARGAGGALNVGCSVIQLSKFQTDVAETLVGLGEFISLQQIFSQIGKQTAEKRGVSDATIESII